MRAHLVGEKVVHYAGSVRRLDPKRKFSSVTTTACAKWLPADVLTSDNYGALLARIVNLLKEYRVDPIV